VRLLRPDRPTDLALGAVLGAALVVAGVLLAPRPGRLAASAGGVAGRPAPAERPTPALPLTVAGPDSDPADVPLRRELQRIATVQTAWRGREGYYTASAASLAYWPIALATVSFAVDSAGDSWTASAFDPGTHRQCAVRVGPAPDPYFPRLGDGVIACRTLSRAGESALWGTSPPTIVWEDGEGREVRAGPPALQRLRAMQVAWLGGDEEDDGSDFVVLRDGQGREPYPDEAGPRSATQDGYVRLADATWGSLGADGRWAAVVHLVEYTGGSGLEGYLAVVRPRAGRFVNGAPYYIGEDTRLLRLRAARGLVTADLVLKGEHDAACCPTDTVRMRFAISGDSLVELDVPADVRLTAGRAGARPARTRLQAAARRLPNTTRFAIRNAASTTPAARASATSGIRSASAARSTAPASSARATRGFARPAVSTPLLSRSSAVAPCTRPALPPPATMARTQRSHAGTPLKSAALTTIPATTARGVAIASSAWSSAGTK